MKRSKHDQNRFSTYLEIHDSFISQYVANNFIGFNTLEFVPYPGNILLRGHLGCSGNIVISVNKFLDVFESNNITFVKTKWYAYNVFIQNAGNIFRYDNQDEDFSFRDGHHDSHHKHLFDWITNNELKNSPVWVGADRWPTLGEVIQETYSWYWANYQDLGSDYPSEKALS